MPSPQCKQSFLFLTENVLMLPSSTTGMSLVQQHFQRKCLFVSQKRIFHVNIYLWICLPHIATIETWPIFSWQHTKRKLIKNCLQECFSGCQKGVLSSPRVTSVAYSTMVWHGGTHTLYVIHMPCMSMGFLHPHNSVNIQWCGDKQNHWVWVPIILSCQIHPK